MPVEVYAQQYVILPNAVSADKRGVRARARKIRETQPPIKAGLIHTIFHDVESLWWVGLWILSWSTTGCVLEDVNKQINTAQTLFPHFGVTEYGFLERAIVLQGGMNFESYIRQLPSDFLEHGVALDDCRRLLCEAYHTSRVPGEDVKKEARSEILSKFRDCLSELFSPTFEDFEIQPLLDVQRSLTQVKRKADKRADDDQTHTKRR